MNKINPLFVLIFLGIYFSNCSDTSENNISIESFFKYEIRDTTIERSQVVMESPDSFNSYESDNVTFITGRGIEYDYFYKENEKKYKFNISGFWDWDLVPLDSVGIIPVVERLLLTYEGANKTEGQSLVKFLYFSTDSTVVMSEETGVIENFANIWLHPPRSGIFHILQIMPYPYIQTPYEMGNKWTYKWKHSFRENSYSYFKKWDGIISNLYTYEIVDREIIRVGEVNIDCWKIEGKAESEIGNTYLTYFFNPNIGFVKMNYKIDEGKEIEIFASKIIF